MLTRITDELAADIGVEVALVVGPEGGKAWPVEVGQDGDGAFLGRGWPEFAEAYGAGAGWLLVLRHRGRGVLFAKAFDDTGCLSELGAPASPAGMFFAGDWSQFLKFHCITEANALLLRYEGNTVFTVKVYEPNGYQKLYKHKENRGQQSERNIMMFLADTEEQREAPSACIQKQQESKRKNNWLGTDGQKRPKGSMASSKMKRKSSEMNCVYELGPPAWLTKKMDTNIMRRHHLVSTVICVLRKMHNRLLIT
ncbi:hypothetical protein HU200_042426 [Digitaria exilis]|uniref:TF-B3 domain-containing protein n=1 Tax=Digitaria exilis TaxID=1010633 RepID=A0A835B559_9POAL|nr:hypothetical protein HU200_042426 [Digitaria exilis]